MGVKVCERHKAISIPTSRKRRIRQNTNLRLSTPNKRIPSDLHTLTNSTRPLRQNPQELHNPHRRMAHELPAPAHPPHGEVIPSGLRLGDIALERVIPRNGIGTLSEVFFVLDLEADVEESLAGEGDGTHFGDAGAEFDAVGDLFVLWVRGVPAVGHAPLVDTELRNPSMSDVRQDEKEMYRRLTIPPGFNTFMISPYTPSQLGACTVASIA